MSKPENIHPNERDLLLCVDGEMQPAEAERIKLHLEACWSCRLRVDQLQETVLSVADFCGKVLAPIAGPPPRQWKTFDAKLQAAMASAGREPLLTRLFKGFFTWRVATGLLAGAACCVLFYWLGRPPVTSANELLERAENSRSQSMRIVREPVVYQKVRIQEGQKSLTRTIWRDTIGGRDKETLEHDAASSARVAAATDLLDEASLSKLFDANRLLWNDPLSPVGYARWRSAAGPVTDQIFRQGSDELTVRTFVVTDSNNVGQANHVSNNDPTKAHILSASLTVRVSDFHPLAEHFQVELNNGAEPTDYQIDVAELDYEVFTVRALSANFFEAQPPARAAEPPIVVAKPAIVSQTSPAELADVEVTVRFALHRIGADLGDPIEVRMDVSQKPSAVVIEGIVSSAERKEELLKTLSEIPHVLVQVQTEEEAISQSLPAIAAPETSITPQTKVDVQSPIERQLLEHCGSPETVEGFSEHVLAVVESLAAHAAALNRISERYPALDSTARQLLDPSSRELLKTMVRDHRSAMREQTVELSNLWNPILRKITAAPLETSGETSLFDSAQRARQLTLHLLFGSRLPNSYNVQEPGQAAQDLLIELVSLRNELKSEE